MLAPVSPGSWQYLSLSLARPCCPGWVWEGMGGWLRFSWSGSAPSSSPGGLAVVVLGQVEAAAPAP
ncbi:hypothetical protein J4Q44_G00172130, partial [Coregonus suidteri]